MLKRILSLLTALLLLCSIPMYALAADGDLMLIDGDDTADSAGDMSGESGYEQTVSALPDWYPEDVGAFELFNDPDADRVVDNADIFSDVEETAMRERISEISAAAGKDIVILTDVTSYGMEQRMLAADFYDFNGYGIGESHDGIILFICMDPAERGWQAVATGAVIDIYTESAANQLDDRLFGYLSAGSYGEGVIDWIGNIGTLYTKGVPFAPSWYTTDYVAPVDYGHTRVSDEAGLLTQDQRDELDASLHEIRDTYGVDAVIHTAASSYGMDAESYAMAFYTMNGYGLGSSADGVLLVIFSDGGINMYVSGAATEVIDSSNEEKLIEAVDAKLTGESFPAMQRWVRYLGKTLKTGTAPTCPEAWAGRGVIGAFVGAVAGLISLLSAKAGMKSVAKADTAEGNLVKNSVKIRSDDRLINVTVSRTYSPIEDDDDDRSGGGGSSFGGGFSGSSGTSHTSSGGRF